MSCEIGREKPIPSGKSLPEVYQRVQRYSDGLLRSPEYKRALELFQAEKHPSFTFFINEGIRRAISGVELLAMITDEQTRENLDRQFDENEIPGRYGHFIQEVVLFDIVVKRSCDGIEDTTEQRLPFGLSALEAIRDQHMREEAEGHITEDTDLSEEQSFISHAAAIKYGHDFIITRYRQELFRSGLFPVKEATPQS